MKTLVKLVVLLVILAMSLPVQGDILIYNKTVTWEGVDFGVEDDVYKETDRGFLILEVTYENGEIVSVDNAIQIIYGGRGGDKWIDEWTHNFEIHRIHDGNIIGYGLVEYDSDDGYFYAISVSGKAKEQNIGNDDPNEVPQSLVGTAIEHDTGNFSERGTYNLRLNNRATRDANQEGMDFDTVYDNVIEYLNGRGYPSIT